MRTTGAKRAVAVALAALALCAACATPARNGFEAISSRQPAGENAVVQWNVVALRTTAAAPFDPPRETRSLAMVHGAVFDAVNSITGGFTPYSDVPRGARGASTAAAVAAAAYHVLVRLYPAQRAALDEEHGRALAAVADGREKDAGIASGEQAATVMLARRAGDLADDAGASAPRPDASVGRWRPTPDAFRPPLDSGWGQVTPFALRRPSQFRPEAPYRLTSRAYARDFNEVKAVGSEQSTVRTADQTTTARFWAATGPQLWNQPAQHLAKARHLTVIETARLFAHLSFAEADAAIAAWDAKFTFGQWRPVTGIREADADGNRATAPDPEWTPLLATPPFPDYVCGHSTLGGAAQVVLESYFGRRPGGTLRLTSAAAPGVTHEFSTFRAIADEVVDARVWAGAHWRTSCTVGTTIGRRIGRFITARTLRPDRQIGALAFAVAGKDGGLLG